MHKDGRRGPVEEADADAPGTERCVSSSKMRCLLARDTVGLKPTCSDSGRTAKFDLRMHWKACIHTGGIRPPTEVAPQGVYPALNCPTT
mmetsp:Transcript_91759/g.296941  ORF Transcript_91759/g.296941 Transcript_91759/m.296941 type:complete len:89 (-) Transcript_91759:276-542(-)